MNDPNFVARASDFFANITDHKNDPAIKSEGT